MRQIKLLALKPLCILLALALLAGCSALRLGYSNGETIGYYWIDSYVDLAPDQQPWAKEQLGTVLAWHRQTQLPDYATLLAAYQERLHQPVSGQDILEDYEDIKARLLRIADKALPELAQLALRLQPDQIAHLEQKFESNNEKFRREHLRGDLEEQQAERSKKVLKQAEYWFGNLSSEQEEQVRAASDARPLSNESWLAERRHRQQVLLKTLRKIQAEKPSAADVQQMLKEYVRMVVHVNGDPQRQLVLAHSRQATADMAATILRLTTPEQKAHAVRQIQKWIADLNRLSLSRS